MFNVIPGQADASAVSDSGNETRLEEDLVAAAGRALKKGKKEGEKDAASKEVGLKSNGCF